jgi:hypothetical protein
LPERQEGAWPTWTPSKVGSCQIGIAPKKTFRRLNSCPWVHKITCQSYFGSALQKTDLKGTLCGKPFLSEKNLNGIDAGLNSNVLFCFAA